MNKKFFSAVLMGALLLGGTFVSCQDYDDDIDNLQEQIDKLASADQLSSKVSELQSAISAAQSAAEAKANAAQTAADKAQTAANAAASDAASKADAALTAAKSYADELKAAADKAAEDYATKTFATEAAKAEAEAALKEAKAAAAAAQKVATDLADAVENAVTVDDVNAAIKVALDDALAKYATVQALEELSKELDGLQDAIKNAVTSKQLEDLAERVAALENAEIPGAPVAVASVNAPGSRVYVNSRWAVWASEAKNKTKAAQARLAKLIAKFPAIANYEQGKQMYQGGRMPVVVNPSNVDLTDNYTFEVIGVDGKKADLKATGVKEGLPAGTTVDGYGRMTTKATAENSIWTVEVEPATGKYSKAESIWEGQSLAIEDGAGNVFKTPFAYVYNHSKANDVAIYSFTNRVDYAPSIDVFETNIFRLENEMTGKFVLSLEEPADVVKYGLSVEGSEIKIAKFPEHETSIIIRDVKIIALGLNGSTAELMKNVYVQKNADYTYTLSDTIIALNMDASKAHKVRWSVDELKAELDAAQFEEVINNVKAGGGSVEIYKGEDYVLWKRLSAYDKNGKVVDWNTSNYNYKNVASIGFDFLFTELPANEYELRVTAHSSLFRATANLTTVYPTSGLIALHEDLCIEGVLQITGDPVSAGSTIVKYNLAEGLKLDESVTIVGFEDVDEGWGAAGATGATQAPKSEVNSDDTHHFVAKYTINGDNENIYEFPFEAQVVSPIYWKDGKNAVTLVKGIGTTEAVFGGRATDTDDKHSDVINLKKAIKDGVGIFAAGYEKGKTYRLFDAEDGEGTPEKKADTIMVANHLKPYLSEGNKYGSYNSVIDLYEDGITNLTAIVNAHKAAKTAYQNATKAGSDWATAKSALETKQTAAASAQQYVEDITLAIEVMIRDTVAARDTVEIMKTKLAEVKAQLGAGVNGVTQNMVNAARADSTSAEGKLATLVAELGKPAEGGNAATGLYLKLETANTKLTTAKTQLATAQTAFDKEDDKVKVLAQKRSEAWAAREAAEKAANVGGKIYTADGKGYVTVGAFDAENILDMEADDRNAETPVYSLNIATWVDIMKVVLSYKTMNPKTGVYDVDIQTWVHVGSNGKLLDRKETPYVKNAKGEDSYIDASNDTIKADATFKKEWTKKGREILATAEESAYLRIYSELQAKMMFNQDAESIIPGTPSTPGAAGEKHYNRLVEEPTFEFADLAKAQKYFEGVTTKKIDDPTELTVVKDAESVTDKVTLTVNMLIKDMWGKTTIVPIELTIYTK